jgi:sugar O-acyltransferase (sialic acid O-acetyltransferase NeuD family)
MTQRLVVLGGPGDGLSVAEAIRHVATASGSVSLAGFLNDVLPRGTILQGVPVLGKLDDWRELDEDLRFVPALQRVKDMPGRVRRVEGLGIPDDRWGVVIHPSAVISSDAEIGVGSFILSCATIQPAARVGRFAGVRSGSMLGHHCTIGDHASVGPNATMCGRSILHEAAHLGPGAVLMDAKVMGRYSVAGIGAAVTKDVADFCIVFGNPARRIGWVQRSIDLKSCRR